MKLHKNLEPTILTANTYFWTPATSAGQRRRNEVNRLQEVADWLRLVGLTVSQHGDAVLAEGKDLLVRFTYRETCQNVYKRLAVIRDGKRSNISALRKAY